MNNNLISILYHIIHPEATKETPIVLQDVFSLFKFHSLEPFLYYANKNKLLICTKEEELKLEKLYQTAVFKTATQEEELKLIKQTLSNHDVAFLPIKGPWVRKFYPSPELRTMADLDILIPKKQLKEVKKMMNSIGYTNTHEGGNHDVYHKKPFMNVEMHRNMIDESYVLSKYYHNIWDKVIKLEETSECSLTNEDHYLFIIAHSAKHFGVGGTGVRSVLDVYFCLQHLNDLNQDYLSQELSKLNLTEYEKRLKHLALGWFDGKPLSEEDCLMGDYLLKSGVYGTTSHAVASELLSTDSVKSLTYKKWKYLWIRAFPSFQFMKRRYPSLRVLFLLLPFYYLYRLFSGLITGKVTAQTKKIKQVNQENLDSNKIIKEQTGVKK